ncbi:FAD-binding protein [Nocardioides sp. TF02-7]|uniref:FAD-binding protein n=1 Tax=Nocardioides sp. TF02-7 TaxID=2917724 RepID=UPI001F06E9AA|nr:FAD-binding protein [Nocardioides sp. TF02-7]UMG91297.1 FAD-binding protein [Nocardioides sp. TF02-7]
MVVPDRRPPHHRRDGGRDGLLCARERALPGSIMVNRHGRRFCNEAANYNALGGAFHRLDESRLDYENVPAYLLLDQATVDRFGVFGSAPGAPVPEWAARAGTIADLAAALGLPAAPLLETVDRFNRHAAEGWTPTTAVAGAPTTAGRAAGRATPTRRSRRSDRWRPRRSTGWRCPSGRSAPRAAPARTPTGGCSTSTATSSTGSTRRAT